MPEVESPLVVRPLTAVVASALMASVTAFFPAAVLVNTLDGPGGAATFVPLVIAAVTAVRGLRVALRVDERGFVVRNVWRTYSLQWDDLREARQLHYWWSPLAVLTPFSLPGVTTEKYGRVVIQAGYGTEAMVSVMNALERRAPDHIRARIEMPFRAS